MAEASMIPQTTRPAIMGTRYMVSAGHYLASAAAVRILEQGGNAFDAGVAAGLCINVLQSDMTNLGGVAPVCVYRADTGAVETISGLGSWPAATDPDFFRREHGGRMPRGILRSVMPAAIDSWLTVLERHGTLTLGQVVEPAVDLAENGFPMHSVMSDTFLDAPSLDAMRSWPSTRAVYLDADGNPATIGQIVIQKDLARTLKLLCLAEIGASNREDGIRAARDRFYTGDIAAAIVDFVQREGGWITKKDLADFRVDIEAAHSIDYRGYRVFSCGPWCQGPVVLMALNILEGYDLANMDRAGAEHCHLVLEALKSAFADRDRYFGDPKFVDVPMDGLLAPEYGAAWRSRAMRGTTRRPVHPRKATGSIRRRRRARASPTPAMFV